MFGYDCTQSPVVYVQSKLFTTWCTRQVVPVATIIGKSAYALFALEDQCEQAEKKQADAAGVLQHLAMRRDSDRRKTDSGVGHTCRRCDGRYVSALAASSCSCEQKHGE